MAHLEHSSASRHQAIPEITNWDAIELMAFYGKKEQVVCPFCGGNKEPEWFTCKDCNDRYGPMAAALVSAEVGRLRVRSSGNYSKAWDEMIDPSLSGLFEKSGGQHKKARKLPEPVITAQVSRENIPEEQITEGIELPILPDADVPVNDPNLVEGEQLILLETEVPVQVLEVIAGDGAAENVPLPLFDMEVSSDNFQPEKVEIPEERTVKKEESLTLSDAEQIDVPEENFPEDKQVMLMPGMLVWHNVAVAMTIRGEKREQFTCPICKRPKEPRKWMCNSCFGKYHEVGLFALKSYLAVLDPLIYVHPPGAYIPDSQEHEALVDAAVTLLTADSGRSISQRPEVFALTLRTLRGVSQEIPLTILKAISREAIRRFQKDQTPMQAKKKELAVEPIAEKYDLRESILISAGMKNLKENGFAAKAFLAFLLKNHIDWKNAKKAKGLRSTDVMFLEIIGYSLASWHYFKKDPEAKGMKVTKAREISEKLGMSLEDALVIGQTLIKEKID
jgi:hypothetical protein